MPIVRVLSTFALSFVIAALASCYNDNPYYCEDRAYDNCGNEPGAFPCRTKADCAGQDGKLSCSEPDGATGFGVCVQCTPSDAATCLGATPVCGADYLCRACGKHTDCASAACLPDGSCGNDADVAYVAAAGSGTECTQAAPCGTLAAAVAKGRAYVKVAAGETIKDTQVTTIDGKAVTILADEGAKLSRDGNNTVLEVRGLADVKIFDLEITGASGAGGHGIDLLDGGPPKLALTRVKLTGNQGMGLRAQGGAVTVLQSTIAGNTGGGISISGVNTTFSITDNFIFYNGRALGTQRSAVGGVAIVSDTAGSKFERNTVAFNESTGLSFRGGASCNAPLAGAGGNLFFRNSEPDGGGGLKNDATTQANLTGGCPFGNSFSAPTDAGNLGFKSPLIAPLDFHLTAASPASVRDAGGSCSGTDVDGDARPQGAACDLGADEYTTN